MLLGCFWVQIIGTTAKGVPLGDEAAIFGETIIAVRLAHVCALGAGLRWWFDAQMAASAAKLVPKFVNDDYWLQFQV